MLERVNSALILVRHGETRYTNIFPDLTPEGIKQIQATSLKLTPVIGNYPTVYLMSSPAIRALGSTQVLKDTLGLGGTTLIVPDLAPFLVKDLSSFLDYDKRNSTPIYGQMWLNDPLLSKDNPLTESRQAVEQRATRFLHYVSVGLDQIARDRQEPLCAVALTHFEIMAPILKGLYTSTGHFPIADRLPPQPGEAVILNILDPQTNQYLIQARGRKALVSLNHSNGHFNRIAPTST